MADKGQGQRNQRFEVGEFKGLSTVLNLPNLKLNLADEALNVAYDIDGGIRKREGFETVPGFTNNNIEKIFNIKVRNTKTSFDTLTNSYLLNETNILNNSNFGFSGNWFTYNPTTGFSEVNNNVVKTFPVLEGPSFANEIELEYMKSSYVNGNIYTWMTSTNAVYNNQYLYGYLAFKDYKNGRLVNTTEFGWNKSGTSPDPNKKIFKTFFDKEGNIYHSIYNLNPISEDNPNGGITYKNNVKFLDYPMFDVDKDSNIYYMKITGFYHGYDTHGAMNGIEFYKKNKLDNQVTKLFSWGNSGDTNNIGGTISDVTASLTTDGRVVVLSTYRDTYNIYKRYVSINEISQKKLCSGNEIIIMPNGKWFTNAPTEANIYIEDASGNMVTVSYESSQSGKTDPKWIDVYSDKFSNIFAKTPIDGENNTGVFIYKYNPTKNIFEIYFPNAYNANDRYYLSDWATERFGSLSGNWDVPTNKSLKYIDLKTDGKNISKIIFNGILKPPATNYPNNTHDFYFYDKDNNPILNDDGTSFKVTGNGTDNIVIFSGSQSVGSIDAKVSKIRYIYSNYFDENFKKINESNITIENYLYSFEVFPEVKDKIQKSELSFEYLDYIIEITKDSDSKYVDICFYNAKDLNNKIEIVVIDRIYKDFFKIEKSDTDEYNITSVGNATILSNGKTLYSFIPIENTSSDGTKKVYVVAGELTDFAEDIKYDEMTIAGNNVLDKNSGRTIRNNEMLNGFPFDVKDIMITSGYKYNALNDERKLVMNLIPNKDYYAFSQVSVEKDADRKSISYTWELWRKTNDNQWSKVVGALSYSGYDKTDNKPTTDLTDWKPDDTTNTHSTFVKINGDKINYSGEYQLKLVSKLNNISSEKVLYLNFDASNESNVIETKTVWDEIKECKYVSNFNGRLVLYGNGTKQIYTSELDRPFYFLANNIVVADSFGKGEDIVGIAPYKDIWIIFTKTTMMSMSGSGDVISSVSDYKQTDPWRILPLDATIGAVAKDAIQPIENTLSFVSRDGIYVVQQLSVADKRVDLAKISMTVNDLAIPFVDDPNVVDEQAMTDIVTTNFEQRLFISYPSKNQMLVYDYMSSDNFLQGKWSTWSGLIPIGFGIYNNELFVLSNKDRKKLYKKLPRQYYDVGELNYKKGFFTDDGEPIVFEFGSKYSDMNDITTFKKVKRVFSTVDNYKIPTPYTVELFADYQTNGVHIVDQVDYAKPAVGGMQLGKTLTTYRPNSTTSSKLFMVSKPGREIKVMIRNEGDTPFVLKGFIVDYTVSKASGRNIK